MSISPNSGLPKLGWESSYIDVNFDCPLHQEKIPDSQSGVAVRRSSLCALKTYSLMLTERWD